jgi:hypothetical protein
MECDRAGIGSTGIAGLNSRCGPTSLVAAEIHLGCGPAGICDGWLHRNIQVACHPGSYKLSSFINRLKNSERNLAAFAAADFEQLA